jgi:uncharacterized protein YecE (DUF72 family)
VTARAVVGMAGWVYPPWRGTFYPPGLRQADELAHAATRVTSIELNGSFYAVPKPASWLAWGAATPDDFVFSAKAPRFVTYIRKLRDPEEPVARFLGSGITALGSKLGAILWQFPAELAYDRDLVETFLATLAGSADEHGTLRHALEPRHPSFDDPGFREQAERFGVAVVLGDTEGGWPVLDWPTTDFAYARLHGDLARYPDGYDDAGIERWADWTRAQLAAGRDAYVYFVTENKVHSPFNAEALLRRLAPNERTDGG